MNDSTIHMQNRKNRSQPHKVISDHKRTNFVHFFEVFYLPLVNILHIKIHFLSKNIKIYTPSHSYK